MIANILKYGSIDSIILYYCTYSGLSDTVDVVIQNSMRLIRNTDFGPLVN